MKKTIFTLFAFTTLSFSSCYYDKEDNLYPKKNCDTSTTNLVYGKAIKTIMDQSCSLPTCHNTFSKQSGVATDTYDGLVNAFTNRNALCTIQQTSGCSMMPKNTTKLPDCTISQIKIWKDRNYPQ